MEADPASAHEFVVRWPDQQTAGVLCGKTFFARSAGEELTTLSGLGSANCAIGGDVAADKPQPFVRRRAASARRNVRTPFVLTASPGRGAQVGSKAPRAFLRGGSGATRRKSALADFRAWRAPTL